MTPSRSIAFLILVLFSVCGCRSLPSAGRASEGLGLGSLEIQLELHGIDPGSVRLWMDGAFIGGVSSEQPVLRVPAGDHTFRAVGRVTDTSDEAGRPILSRPFEQKIRILGGDGRQKLVIALSPPPGI